MTKIYLANETNEGWVLTRSYPRLKEAIEAVATMNPETHKQYKILKELNVSTDIKIVQGQFKHKSYHKKQG